MDIERTCETPSCDHILIGSDEFLCDECAERVTEEHLIMITSMEYPRNEEAF